jgi:hypothetical protein
VQAIEFFCNAEIEAGQLFGILPQKATTPGFACFAFATQIKKKNILTHLVLLKKLNVPDRISDSHRVHWQAWKPEQAD